MPTKRTPITRRPIELSETEWRWLTDEPEASSDEGGNPFERMMLDGPQRDEGDAARELWKAHRDEVLALWAREYPGTRPSNWWRFDAPRLPAGAWPGCWFDGRLPEPRQRVGGIGTAAFECMAYVPDFDHGVPTIWITAEHYETKRRLANGTLGHTREGSFVAEHLELTAPAFDLTDPPLYESEAAYLERHGLLTAGEYRRLTAADFEPEAVPIQDDD